MGGENKDMVDRPKVYWSRTCATCGMPRAFHDVRLYWSKYFDYNFSGMCLMQMRSNSDGTKSVELCAEFREAKDAETGEP